MSAISNNVSGGTPSARAATVAATAPPSQSHFSLYGYHLILHIKTILISSN
ncbi:MAG: hypothetical protein MPW14_26185 (plasmid) [Candidatus Manganitrophus sp.]|nr:MAG: hypothetical protein MPW14_26185 [Candidatus Manganitrophus sp.]